jgi:hypothetical protein
MQISASCYNLSLKNYKTMSKDRQAVKEKKKPAAEGSKKAPSDYQSGKKDSVKPIGDPAKKKK